MNHWNFAKGQQGLNWSLPCQGNRNVCITLAFANGCVSRSTSVWMEQERIVPICVIGRVGSFGSK